MADTNDWLGGYTLQELLGAPPVSMSKKQLKKQTKLDKKASGKRGIVSTVVGAPVRLVVSLVKLPVTVLTRIVEGIAKALTEFVKLPVRVVGALASPWRK